MTKKSNSSVIDQMQGLLADTYVLYLKTQNYHWNVTGPNFSGLHLLFEQQYSELAQAVDAIAERIRSCGSYADGSFKTFLSRASIDEETGHPNAQEMLRRLAADNRQLAEIASTLQKNAEAEGDLGSADLAAGRISLHEKAAWMLEASID